MKISRDSYINELMIRRQNGMIKVVTGMRRAGKSYLLLKLFHEKLIEEGVPEDHILELALDDLREIELRNPQNMMAWIESKIKDKQQYYLILDEVQFLGEFAAVLNSCLHIDNLDVYATGSNSRFLSTDILTEFRGRGDQVHVYPLSFSEYSSACQLPERTALNEYLRYGGLPYILSCKTDAQKVQYLDSLWREVYLRDIIEHNRILHSKELEELLSVYASSIGSLSSLRKLADTFKSAKGMTLSINTIGTYSDFLEDAFLINKAVRYDIKGRKYIDSPVKFYFEDLGIRNACLNFRQVERNHLMENAIYNELRLRGWNVDVGMVVVNSRNEQGTSERKQLEIDFVCNKGSKRCYIQSVLSLPDREKMQQEINSLHRIDDSFQKIVVVGGNVKPWMDENGILFLSVYDFMLNPESVS